MTDHRKLTTEGIARVYDVPPWLVDVMWPVPRFPRLRWALRRVWRLTPPTEDES